MENHFAGVRVLHRDAVYARANREGMRVRDFIACREVGPGWAERVARFTADPLLVAELPDPGGDIIERHIARNVFERACRRDGFSAAADDDGQLRLVVDI